MNPPPKLPLGTHPVSDMEKIDFTAGVAVIRKLLQTREIRRLLGNLLPEVLRVYAGNSRIQQWIAGIVGRRLEKSLLRHGDIVEPAELKQLFEDETFIETCIASLPELVAAMFDIIDTATATIEGLETREKKILFSDFIANMALGRTGSLLTRGCRILNEVHREDPECFAKILEPEFRKWIESIDFAELREMVDSFGRDTRAFANMANDVLWEYPAKVVLLLSLIPSAVNLLVDTLDISTGRLNDLPPDLLTDVLLSFVREIHGRPVANLVNQLTEIVRKIYTGSALLGEPGAPQLPWVISGKIEEIIDGIDPVILWKAKNALAEIRATFEQAVSDALSRNPALLRLGMIQGPELANIRVRAKNRALAFWETLDDEEAARLKSQNLAAYDVQEMAEVVNQFLRLFNRVGDRKPELVPEMARQFTDALDGYELAEASRKLFLEAGGSMRPAARAVVPQLVLWVADILKPGDDEHEDAAARARDALREMFSREEV